MEGTDCEEFEGPCIDGEIGFDKLGRWSVKLGCTALRFDGENGSVRLSRTDSFSAVDSMK